MGRMRKKNVGDRIYYESFDGSIGTAVITRIREQEGSKKYGQPDIYYIYETGPCSIIESYNCLADSNPKVRKYISENKHMIGFEDAFVTWMRDNGYKLENPLVKETLAKYAF